MLQVEVTHPDGSTRTLHVPADSVIGKGAQCEIRLDSWRIGKEHAHLFRTPAGILIEDVGAFGGVQINGQRINGQFGPLKQNDVVGIGPFKLTVREHGPDTTQDAAHGARRPLHAEFPAQATGAAPTHSVVAGIPASTSTVAELPVPHADTARRELEFEWRKLLHGRLLEAMDLRRQDVHHMSDDRLRSETGRLIAALLAELDAEIPAELDRAHLSSQVLDEAIGLGPLEELLADDSVTEIMVNRYDEIYVERAGRLIRHPLAFTGHRAVIGVIERIVTPLGRRIDESSPMVDARLKDGSRVNAVIPPLALKGPCVTIRKFARRKLEASDLVRHGSLDGAMATFLQVCVEARKNIIVSGGTGSGKTTLLNILSNFIPPGERVITVEDAAELKLHHAHLISLEARPSNVEGKGAVQIRDLVRNTLRMRPDRIVVGECRGAEALDMLQAMNTGHEGSLTTLHANTVRDALARLETMVLMAGMDLPLSAIREQIASAVDIVIQQSRFACGSRIVTSVAEITGIESGKIQMQELFRFHNEGYGAADGKVKGLFTGCGIVPSFYDELRATGRELDIEIFMTADVGLEALGEDLV
ncbi:Flp pilus assembly complex ATPase component TadA [Azoarcus sp. L1K30]|uniref:ATPase, T2SS/T4P/T4SS family n=1 Tax=Azoarcus sp. L1K30 TaxID=2820277 RepID=UPI001B83E656|nr:ATPase, T2SS/T4P/T4SS family [Azoarcus sp. L1K30]MBR0567417.1 Flp pilus assembly complex ATPase component TadA [Azoarcus sp. L1K30]